MKCGAEVRSDNQDLTSGLQREGSEPMKFCGACGTAVEPLGSSSLRIDRDGVNLILHELSPALSFGEGRLHMAQGPLQGALGLQLNAPSLDASLRWNGLEFRIEQLETDDEGVEIGFRIGFRKGGALEA